MKFTIQRSKWYRGKGVDGSSLLRAEDGTQCCIGQCAIQCGVSEEDISGVGDIQAAISAGVSIPAPLVGDMGEAGWLGTAYPINDSRFIDDATREQQLAALAAANGHEFAFVD